LPVIVLANAAHASRNGNAAADDAGADPPGAERGPAGAGRIPSRHHGRGAVQPAMRPFRIDHGEGALRSQGAGGRGFPAFRKPLGSDRGKREAFPFRETGAGKRKKSSFPGIFLSPLTVQTTPLCMVCQFGVEA